MLDQSIPPKGSNEKKNHNPTQRSQQQSSRGDVALAGHGRGQPAPWDGDAPWSPPGDAERGSWWAEGFWGHPGGLAEG